MKRPYFYDAIKKLKSFDTKNSFYLEFSQLCTVLHFYRRTVE